ncbi:hypothetical protein GJ496_011634 [Pomphorhynchus laevis]|nr:hypothetical protein GJ496_011634 [Pomphorhynchus laevis]
MGDLGARSGDSAGDVPFDGFGLDYCMIPFRQNNDFSLIQSTDFFYPLIEDPFKMGKIACANVLSDVYASGLTTLISIQMILSTCTRIEDENIRNEVVRLLIAGFDETATEAGLHVGHLFLGPNPWIIVGGVATAIHGPLDSVMTNDNASIGDVLILTKPLGTQVAANLHQWMVNDDERWKSLKLYLDKDDVSKAYERAISSMMRLNKSAASLMLKYKATAATDVTGFGLIGHADNLIKRQKNRGIQFSIRVLPIIQCMQLVNNMMKNMFKLLEGKSAETSGGLLIALPPDAASQYCQEINEIEGRRAYIIGVVCKNSNSQCNEVTIIDEVDVLEVPMNKDQMFV